MVSTKLMTDLRPSRRPRPLTIVTAADVTHGDSLVHFLKSALRHESGSRLIAYDLGLSSAQRRRAANLSRDIEVRNFDYSLYPEWFDVRMEAGQYAWKPVIVGSVVQAAEGPVAWMDSGNLILGPLDALYEGIVEFGFTSPISSGDIRQFTHPATLEFFGLDASWGEGRRNMNGASVAFDPKHHAGANLAADWMRYAQVREAIAPVGSSRANHRQDQALLGVLAHRAGFLGGLFNYVNYIIHTDIEQLHARKEEIARICREVQVLREDPSAFLPSTTHFIQTLSDTTNL